MMQCASEFSTMQQRFCEAESQLKSLQQTRQKDIWQLLYRWSLEVSYKLACVYHLHWYINIHYQSDNQENQY